MLGPRSLLASFVLLLLLPAAAVVWLGLRLLAQERAQESHELLDRRETVCARLVASLDQALASTERSLTGPPAGQTNLAEDAVFLTLRPDRIEAYPKERLLYSPVLPTDAAEPTAAF